MTGKDVYEIVIGLIGLSSLVALGVVILFLVGLFA